MRKVNRYHQEKLDQAFLRGIDLSDIRKNYGLTFALKLFRHVDNKAKNKPKVVSPIYPISKPGVIIDSDDYVEMLKDAGLKIKKYSEDFIDEDTGEVVRVNRFMLRTLKK